MARKSTWTNPDGLVVGYGPHYAERHDAGAIMDVDGSVQEQVLDISWESTFGESNSYIQLPKYASVVDMWLEVIVAWASGDSGTLSVGHTEADTADVDAFMTTTDLAAAALTPAGKKIRGNGVYFSADTDTTALEKPAVLTDDFDDSTIGVKVFLTKTNNFTAGQARLHVRYR